MKAIDRVMVAYTRAHPDLTETQTEIARRELTKCIEEFAGEHFPREVRHSTEAASTRLTQK